MNLERRGASYRWLFFVGLVGLLAGLGIARQFDNVDQHPGAEELKLSVHNLKNLDKESSPQLREYLKGRIYALVAGGIRKEWVDGDVDFGPLDRKTLGTLVVVKGPESDEELYRMAMSSTEARAKKIK
jgi:hypothetical protein